MAQWWENLLWSSGGQLELSKCFFYCMHWHFDAAGRPQLATKELLEEMGHRVDIIESASDEVVTISMKDCAEAHRTLGVMGIPIGTMKDEAAKRKIKSRKIATNARTSAVTKHEGWTYYHSTWLSAMNYGLEATFLSKKQCKSIEAQSNHVFLNAIGFPKSFPSDMVSAPKTAGGVGFRSIWGRARLSEDRQDHNSTRKTR